MDIDPVQTEIMKNRFLAIAEEAASVAFRAAHTTFVKQTQDFEVAVANLAGEFFAYPVQTGVITFSGHNISEFVKHFPVEEFKPGDVLITNCPFATAGVVTHMMDIHLIRPIFVDGKLTCYAWAFIHASDIGGAVPGSISPDLYECFQEGLRLRPVKLVKAGELNQDVVCILRDNSRVGDAIWGDLEAMMAAMRLLETRINELYTRVGAQMFHQGIDNVMAYGELKARQVIARLPDGEYSFTDYLEGDANCPTMKIHCKLTIKGDQAFIDYSGSSPQVHAAFNFATGHSGAHPYLSLALTNYILTMEPDIPINGGIMRPIRGYAPPGTIMNAQFPAAMGSRFVAVMRMYDALIGCLNQAIPGGIAACGAGLAAAIMASWSDAKTGHLHVASVEPFSGGSGGRVRANGVDATDTLIGILKSAPIEHVEIETPLIVRRHDLVPGSFGHGRHRGGAAIRIEVESRAPGVTLSVRGLDRFRLQPWGVFGGTAGGNCTTTLFPHEGEEQHLGRIKVLNLHQFDLLKMVSSGGGGFGNPWERPAEQVLRDVLDEMLTAKEAEDIYKVVIVNREVDAEATARLRSAYADLPGTYSVDLGENRIAFEKLWPPETSQAMSELVLGLPPGARRHAMERVRRTIETAKETVTVRDIERIVLA